MAYLRRHWRSWSLVVVLAAAITLAVWHGLDRATAQADPVYDPIAATDREAIRDTLAAIDLDVEALTALNLSSRQAETILATARTWQTQQDQTLARLRAAAHERAGTLRRLQMTIETGPADPERDEALAQARTNLRTARTAYHDARNSLRSAITEELSQSQVTMWQVVSQRQGQPMPWRAIALTNAQREALDGAWDHYRWTQAAAENSDARDAAIAAWETAVTQILTQDQGTVLAAYYEGFEQASLNVSNAYDTVLPPAEG
jgi:hypothetical protein